MTDTIAAISTAVGQAGLSVIRMSGQTAFEVADRCFKKGNRLNNSPELEENNDVIQLGTFKNHEIIQSVTSVKQETQQPVTSMDSHTIAYGQLYWPDTGAKIDEIILMKMAAPRTYTRENTVELQIHGGYVLALEVLRLLFSLGVRAAEPGEFTKRAFLNGRIDLVEAEAVIDLIQSHTTAGARVALDQMDGRLSEKIARYRRDILGALGHLEVNLDYPEHDEEEMTLETLKKMLMTVEQEMKILLDGFQVGKILREGLPAAIIGKPNVGKSSLMNRLSGKNRSIVTEIPGTTRDIIEEYVNILGIPLKLMDTAGLRDTEDIVEKIGVDRAHEALENAGLILALFDASVTMDEMDRRIFKTIEDQINKTIFIINKADIAKPGVVEDLKKSIKELCTSEPLIISALQDEGLDALEKRISEISSIAGADWDNQVLLTNSRHERLLNEACAQIKEARVACENAVTLDIIAFMMKAGLESLGRITGDHASEDLLHDIFSRFCIGK
jgi:tRNA modification GTPase